MLSFHNKPEVKEFYLSRVKAHNAADEIVKGIYWEGGKGCAVGCTVHSSSHADYETEIGVPRIIARLQDRIFEGMSNEKAKDFPVRFLENIPVGVDIDNVWRKFLSWLLIDETEGVIRHAKTEAVRVSILNVGSLLEKSTVETVSYLEFMEARKAAADAAAAAMLMLMLLMLMLLLLMLMLLLLLLMLMLMLLMLLLLLLLLLMLLLLMLLLLLLLMLMLLLLMLMLLMLLMLMLRPANTTSWLKNCWNF